MAKISLLITPAVEEPLKHTYEEMHHLWTWDVVSATSDWQKKICLIVRLRTMGNTWKIKATERASRRRTEKIRVLESQKWTMFYLSEKDIFKGIQTKHFISERREASKKQVTGPNGRIQVTLKASPLSPHNPFMQEDGLLRVGSRLIHAPIKEGAKYPILVPKGDSNVQAYIRHIHRQEGHAGAMHVLCQTRQKIWILQGLQ